MNRASDEFYIGVACLDKARAVADLLLNQADCGSAITLRSTPDNRNSRTEIVAVYDVLEDRRPGYWLLEEGADYWDVRLTPAATRG